MGHKLIGSISSTDLAAELSLEFSGDDINIYEFSSLKSAKKGSLTFAITAIQISFIEGVTIICSENSPVPKGCCCIYSQNPRLTFATVVSKFSPKNNLTKIAETAYISSSAKIGKNVSIGHNTVISSDVVIGNNCEIGHNVTISNKVVIGNNTRIKSSSVIGEKGFGFEYDSLGIPIEFPQIGGVIIGSNVEIGAVCTVASGTLDPTVINDYVKIDDHVHVAHNVIIGEASIITACAEFSGGVITGKRVWVGPQAALMNKIKIGDNSLIGLGSVVRKDVEDNSIVAGNPAKLLRKK